MHRLKISLVLFALFLVSLADLHAQCYGNAQAENATCGPTPRTLSVFTTCGNCTHNWTPAPQSGQGTAVATYVYTVTDGWGHVVATPSVSSYNPNVPCSYGDMWQVGVGRKPSIALPSLQNGPWNGDTSKVWIYARTYLNPSPQVSGSYTFNPSWTVSGGTVQRTRHLLTGFNYFDSVLVKWTGAGPMLLNEAQSTAHTPQNMITNFFCNWNPAATVVAYPSLAVFSNGNVCTGGTKNFFTFPYNNSTYTWSVSNGSVVSGQGTNSAMIQVNGVATVTVVRDSVGNQTTANASVTPLNPVVNLGPDQSVCQGTSVTLNAGSGFTNYAWSTGATTQSIVASSPGQYRVTASINGGCYAYDTIQISHIPVVRPNLGPDIHTCTLPVTLNAGAGYNSYLWSNGANTQTIAPSVGGTYRVTVTDGNGCVSSDTAVVFDERPTVNLGANTTFCYPGAYTITAGVGNAASYLWSNGSPAFSYPPLTTLGPQTVWLQVTSAYGCTAADTVVVTGIPRPTPNAGPDISVCPGTSVVMDGGPGYVSYQWSNFQYAQTITVSTPGNYVVTVTDAAGCTGVDTVALFNYPFANPNLGPDINVCQASAALDAGSGYLAYFWNTGAVSQTINVTTAGTYSVTVTSANGCNGSDDINVSFNNIVMSLGPDVNVCQPQQVTLDPQLTGIFTYNWSTGASTPTVTLSVPGSYAVTLTAANTFGCTATDTVLVTLLPTPSINLGNDTLICADTSLTLDAGGAFVSYLWNTGATTQSIAATDGHYEIAATAANGCIGRDTLNLSGLIDCVFPGDINYDLSVDLMDVLSMGPAMAMTGSTRPNASLNWYGQRCSNWPWNVTLGVNAKQADTDGNGVVNAADTLAVQLNFGNTHSRLGTVATGSSQLRIVPLNTPVQAGDIAYFGVYYEGLASTALDSVHGLAMQLSWPTTGLGSAGLIGVDYTNAWFAPSGNHLDFTRTSSTSAHLAITRTSGIDTSGQGLVMTLAFQTDSNMAPGNSVSFAPIVVASTGVSAGLVPESPSSNVTPITVSGAVAVGEQTLTHVSIMPIPADDQLKVLVEGLVADGKIQLVNMLGQVIVEIPVAADQWHVLSTTQIPSGAYGLRVQTSQGMFFKQVLIQH